MPVEAREWKAEGAVRGINRGLLAVWLVNQDGDEKWPIEWAGMLWEKMHRAEQQQAVAAAIAAAAATKSYRLISRG